MVNAPNFTRRNVLQTTGSLALGLAAAGRTVANRDTLQSQRDPSSPPEAWNEVYHRNEYDYPRAVTETTDGDYLMTGHTAVNDTRGFDVWVLRLASDGTVQWSKTFGGDQHDVPNDIIEVNDGSFVITGYQENRSDNRWNGILIKVSSGGDLQGRWLYESEYSIFDSVVETKSHNYVTAGDGAAAEKGTERETDGLLVKWTSDGQQAWKQRINNSRSDGFRHITTTGDDGFLLCGYTSFLQNEKPSKGWVVKTNVTGDPKWQKQLKRTTGDPQLNRGDNLYTAAATNDGYLFGGETMTKDDTSLDSYASEAWLVKLAPDGTKQWSETYGPSLNDRVESVVETRDGDYLFAGSISENTGDGSNNYKYWLVKVAPDGTKRWEQTYSRSPADYARDVIETSEGDYLLVGETSKFSEQEGLTRSDAWVLKLDVNDPPKAAFSVSEDPTVGRPVRFSAAPASDPDGSIGTYEWDLTGDGSVDARGQVVEHTFARPGEHTVGLTVVDQRGERATAERTVRVAATPTPTPTRSPTPTTTAPATATSTGDVDSDASTGLASMLGAGAGAAALAGALRWWRRRG